MKVEIESPNTLDNIGDRKTVLQEMFSGDFTFAKRCFRISFLQTGVGAISPSGIQVSDVPRQFFSGFSSPGDSIGGQTMLVILPFF